MTTFHTQGKLLLNDNLCPYFRESSIPVDMRPLPKEPDEEKKRRIKTPKSKLDVIIPGEKLVSY